jgi:hypothetical protein
MTTKKQERLFGQKHKTWGTPIGRKEHLKLEIDQFDNLLTLSFNLCPGE